MEMFKQNLLHNKSVFALPGLNKSIIIVGGKNFELGW